MESFSFLASINELEDKKEQGITFEDKQKTWNSAEDVKDVVNALEDATVVHYLRLEGNTLGVEAAAAIGKALSKHSEFRKALWRNMFTGRLKNEIPLALGHLSNGLKTAFAQLVVLDLSDNALGPNGMVGLESLLSSHVCYTLQELRLNNCGLGIDGGRMLSNAILACHENSTAAGTPLKLKIFVTGRNRLENKGAQSIAKIFATLKTLEKIIMPQNSIYAAGVKALAAGLKECKNLQVLNLNDNTVTHDGVKYIAEALSFTPHLRELNLGDCLLKTNGAYILSEALQKDLEELEVLELGYNEIGADGGLVLAQAVVNKNRLKSLDLNGNEFGLQGREGLKEIMKNCVNANVLQPLYDDESEQGSDRDNESHEHDTEDEDDDDEDEEEFEDYENDYDEEAEYCGNDSSTDNDEEQSSIMKTNHLKNLVDLSTKDFSAQTFCLSQTPCSLIEFNALPGDDKHETLAQFIRLYTGENHKLLLIFTALKCGHLSKSSNDALEVAMQLFREVLELAVQTKEECGILSYLLKQLGLLRSEEKFKSGYDKLNCQFAFKKSVQNYHVSSEYIRNVLEVFLEMINE